MVARDAVPTSSTPTRDTTSLDAGSICASGASFPGLLAVASRRTIGSAGIAGLSSARMLGLPASASCAFVSSVLLILISLCSPWLAPSSVVGSLIGFVSDSKNDLIVELTKLEFIKQAKVQTVEEWGEDIPATLLFARLGGAIATKLGELSAEEKSCVFRLIEEGMRSEDGNLKALVATGLLESLSSRVAVDRHMEGLLDSQLGEESKNI